MAFYKTTRSSQMKWYVQIAIVAAKTGLQNVKVFDASIMYKAMNLLLVHGCFKPAKN